MKTLSFILLLLLSTSIAHATAPCDNYSPSFHGHFPFKNHGLPDGSVVEVPSQLIYVVYASNYDPIFENDVAMSVVEKSPFKFPWGNPRWAVMFTDEKLQHESSITSRGDNLVLKVNENYKYKPGPTVISLKPEIYFEPPGLIFGKCNPERTLTLHVKYKDGNVPELGMVAFVYIASTVEDLDKPEALFYLDHTKDGVSFDIAGGTPGVDTLNQPFCVAIELLDIAGRRSPRSAPLCIDPTDKSAPYFSGDGCCSVVVEKPFHGKSIPILLMLLVCGVYRRHSALN